MNSIDPKYSGLISINFEMRGETEYHFLPGEEEVVTLMLSVARTVGYAKDQQKRWGLNFYGKDSGKTSSPDSVEYEVRRVLSVLEELPIEDRKALPQLIKPIIPILTTLYAEATQENRPILVMPHMVVLLAPDIREPFIDLIRTISNQTRVNAGRRATIVRLMKNGPILPGIVFNQVREILNASVIGEDIKNMMTAHLIDQCLVEKQMHNYIENLLREKIKNLALIRFVVAGILSNPLALFDELIPERESLYQTAFSMKHLLIESKLYRDCSALFPISITPVTEDALQTRVSEFQLDLTPSIEQTPPIGPLSPIALPVNDLDIQLPETPPKAGLIVQSSIAQSSIAQPSIGKSPVASCEKDDLEEINLEAFSSLERPQIAAEIKMIQGIFQNRFTPDTVQHLYHCLESGALHSVSIKYLIEQMFIQFSSAKGMEAHPSYILANRMQQLLTDEQHIAFDQWIRALINEELVFSPLSFDLFNKKYYFDFSCLRDSQELRLGPAELPKINSHLLLALIEKLKSRLAHPFLSFKVLEKLNDQVKEICGETTLKALQKRLENISFALFLKRPELVHLIAPTGEMVAHFYAIMYAIQDQFIGLEPCDLSKGERLLLRFMASLEGPSSLRRWQLMIAYHQLPPQYHYRLTASKEAPRGIEGVIHHYLIELFFTESGLIRELAEQPEGPIPHLLTQSDYLMNTLGKRLGWVESGHFSIDGIEAVNPSLMKKNLSQLMEAFFRHFSLDTIVQKLSEHAFPGDWHLKYIQKMLSESDLQIEPILMLDSQGHQLFSFHDRRVWELMLIKTQLARPLQGTKRKLDT